MEANAAPIAPPISNSLSTETPPIYDMIVVEPIPAVHVALRQTPHGEPATFFDSTHGPNAEQRIEVMKAEMNVLKDRGTWTLPKGRKAVGVNWVYEVKSDASFKARLVAKGCSQPAGIDYDKTFAPVVRIKNVRLLIGLALHRGHKIRHVDIKSGLLYSHADF
jgi:Reverse transcriptase (RNA-dependent DNA polymerase)